MKLGIKTLTGLLGAALLCGCNSAEGRIESARAVSAPERPGMTLVWADEFEGDALDRTKWQAETSCWGGGNYERQCYTDRPDNIQVKDGYLHLIAKPESFTGERFSQEKTDRGGLTTQSHTSGKVRTYGLADWTYGRFEARIRLPQGQSTWPAFWMLPEENAYGKWPLSGEIDIMEAVNLGEPCTDCGPVGIETRTGAALHFGQPWPHNNVLFKRQALPGEPTDFHIFAAEWAPDHIQWYVDGDLVYKVDKADWHTATIPKSENPSAPFDQGFHLILNLAVGGNLPDGEGRGPFEPASFPAEMVIDWVRVYQNN